MDLIAKLRRKSQVFPAQGSGFISTDSKGRTTSGSTITDDGYRLVNPDGPEAATALERACEALTDARELLWHFRQEAPLESQPPYEKLSSSFAKIDEALSLIRVSNG